MKKEKFYDFVGSFRFAAGFLVGFLISNLCVGFMVFIYFESREPVHIQTFAIVITALIGFGGVMYQNWSARRTVGKEREKSNKERIAILLHTLDDRHDQLSRALLLYRRDVQELGNIEAFKCYCNFITRTNVDELYWARSEEMLLGVPEKYLAYLFLCTDGFIGAVKNAKTYQRGIEQEEYFTVLPGETEDRSTRIIRRAIEVEELAVQLMTLLKTG